MTCHAPATTESAAASAAQCRCCIVGAGPAGALLSLLLSRLGVEVILLEAHRDFDRDFRGDAVFPWVLELLDQLGLAERVLEIPHAKVRGYVYDTLDGESLVTDYSRLQTAFNFVTAIPQARLLEFIVGQAPVSHFQILMGAAVQELIEEDGLVRGVRYRDAEGTHEVRALLTVGADGRFSRVRKIAGLEQIKTWPTLFDVLWFRLPRYPGEDMGINQRTRFGRGYYVSFVDRQDNWQLSYTIPKGSYPQIRAAGIEAFRRSITDIEPRLGERMSAVDWTQVRFLPVEVSRARRWYRPGLLLIGDAAHVMSPIGGVGITCAMQDAVVAANALGERLRAGRLEVPALARVQRQREVPTRAMQFLQHLVERAYVDRVFDSKQRFRTPALFRLPGMNRLTAYVTAYGVWPVRLKGASRAAAGERIQPHVGGPQPGTSAGS